MKKDMTIVYFGGAIAFYVDEKLDEFAVGKFAKEELFDYLLNNISEDFGSLEKVYISDESSYWEMDKGFASVDWRPKESLVELKGWLDCETDAIVRGENDKRKLIESYEKRVKLIFSDFSLTGSILESTYIDGIRNEDLTECYIDNRVKKSKKNTETIRTSYQRLFKRSSERKTASI